MVFNRGLSEMPPKRVLIVDDNKDAADTLAQLLQLEGHETQAAYSSREALENAQKFGPDIMLLDIGLPGMNGYEVAKALRSQPGANHLCLIAVTGYGRPIDREFALTAGFDDHLMKPLDIAALRRAMEELITDKT
jgi:CheY-like chemotaxis protein